jgi:2-polyprenyl-3-methyl-5-hydroxy-6-metoxy-1,4-benzoquinol methylase
MAEDSTQGGKVIPSRVMRMSDYDNLKDELAYVDKIAELSGGWNAVQHPHRRWEYALMLQVAKQWAQAKMRVPKNCTEAIKVADVGGGIGETSRLMLSYDCDVTMYEPWVYGDETDKFMGQIATLRKNLSSELKTVRMCNRPLCNLDQDDKNAYDAVFCISTLEHIGAYQLAFHELLQMVKPGGLVFLTTDYAEDEVDHYANANLRAGIMFNEQTYQRLAAYGEQNGFVLVGGKSEWKWSEDCRLVNDSGFASLAMVRP